MTNYIYIYIICPTYYNLVPISYPSIYIYIYIYTRDMIYAYLMGLTNLMVDLEK
jgi:hypothetical protein